MSTCSIKCTLNQEKTLKCTLSSNNLSINGVLKTASIQSDPYNGAYVITPRTVSQTFDTSDKLMKEDLLVKEIEIKKVSNATGYTVNIAT